MRSDSLPRCAALAALMLGGAVGCQVILGIDSDVPIVTEGSTPCDPNQVDDDPNHCGACGHSCLGAACSAGTCQPVVLATFSGVPTDVALDADFVYWSTEDGTVRRVAKNGQGEAILISGITPGIARIAVDDTRVYFRERSDNNGTPSIRAANKDGTSPLFVASNQPGRAGLALGGGALLWARTDDTNVGGIQRAVIDGSGNVTVKAITAQDLQFPQEVAADGDSVFWGQDTTGQVWRAAADGSGQPAQLYGCGEYVNAIAIDAANAYWTTDSGEVFTAQKGDSISTGCSAASARALASSSSASALGVAVGGDLVVWTIPSLGQVRATAKSGACSPPPCERQLAGSQASPGRIAADTRAAYWLNAGDGTVAKVAF